MLYQPLLKDKKMSNKTLYILMAFVIVAILVFPIFIK